MDVASNPVSPAHATTAPDWSAIERDVLCPMCRYNLRGLTEPRCPECGYRFDWDELLHPERLMQEYLFESRPEHSGRAFVRTLWTSLRARRFWSSISPTQRAAAWRLLFYWALGAIPLMLGFSANMGWTMGTEFRISETVATFVTDILNSSRWGNGGWGPPRLDLAEAAMLIALALAAWPWLTFLALSVFIESMFRTRIHGVHVLRCVTYTAGVVTMLVGVAVATLGAVVVVTEPQSLRLDWAGVIELALVAALLWAWLSWRLVVAYRHYMRFDHPVATVFASQAIVALALLTLAMWAAFFGA